VILVCLVERLCKFSIVGCIHSDALNPLIEWLAVNQDVIMQVGKRLTSCCWAPIEKLFRWPDRSSYWKKCRIRARNFNANAINLVNLFSGRDISLERVEVWRKCGERCSI
jgi:hypothetical protein